MFIHFLIYVCIFVCVHSSVKITLRHSKEREDRREKEEKKIEDLDVQADGARVRYGIMGCQVSKGRMYLYKIRWIFGQKATYRTSSYSFHGNYSFFNLEIVAHSNSCPNISKFYLIN